MKNARVAICEWSLPIKGPAMFPLCKEVGLDGVQIDDWSSWEHSFPLSDKKVQDLYLDMVKRTGVSIPSMGCNGFSRLGGFTNRVGTEEGQQSINAILQSRKICEEMSIPLVMFPCCWSGFIKTEEDLENMAKMLRLVAPAFESSPVELAIESVLSPKQYADLFSYVGSNKMKIYYDTQNPQYFASVYPPDEMRELDISTVAEIHFKDGLRKSQGSVYYGEGETGFADMVSVLKEKGYEGYLVIENFYNKVTWSHKEESVWVSIKEDVKRLKQAFRD